MLFSPLLIASTHVADDIEAEHYAKIYGVCAKVGRR